MPWFSSPPAVAAAPTAVPTAAPRSSWFGRSTAAPMPVGTAVPMPVGTAVPMPVGTAAPMPVAVAAQGNVSLEEAIDSRNTNMVKSLIKQGVNVNQIIDGAPALIYTIQHVFLEDPIKEEIVQILIGSGADVNLVGNAYPMTALYAAVWQGNINIMKMILAKKPINIDTKVQIKKRDTPRSPMDYAIANQYWDLAQILASYGASITPEQKARLTAAAPPPPARKGWWGGKRRKTIRRKTKARKTKSRR